MDAFCVVGQKVLLGLNKEEVDPVLVLEKKLRNFICLKHLKRSVFRPKAFNLL